jgi:hypothetical protein
MSGAVGMEQVLCRFSSSLRGMRWSTCSVPTTTLTGTPDTFRPPDTFDTFR